MDIDSIYLMKKSKMLPTEKTVQQACESSDVCGYFWVVFRVNISLIFFFFFFLFFFFFFSLKIR